jgi:threonine/homoserine/homoserine lactone efflux protein
MSVTSAVLSFAVVAGLVTIIPGLDTALVLRAAIRDGPRAAFATAVGIGTGALAWGAAAAVGVSALLTASTLAYDGLRIVGACYLVWFGVRLLWSAVVRPSAASNPSPDGSLDPALDGPLDPAGRPALDGPPTPAVAPTGLGSAWRRGLLTNLLNPKIGAFYLAVLPQFVPEHTSALAMGLLLAFVHDLEGMLWFGVIIVGATRMRRLLQRRRAQQVVDGVTGSALIGFGLRLGLSR